VINALQPGLNLAGQEVSDENEKGRHTTSHARLLRLDFGGYVVDTPGIRQFDLWAVEPGELEAYFVEFAPLVPQCRFNDCHHRDEEGCAVVAEVQSGQISERRYLSYLKTLEELAQERRDKYR
jgi:ribosome biogenesis GTPase